MDKARPTPVTDVTKALLNLYECLIDESHVEQMIAVVGSWLADADEPLITVQLERHSRALLDQVTGGIQANQLETGDDAVVNVPADSLSAQQAMETKLAVQIDDNDWQLFWQRRQEQNEGQMILRYHQTWDETDDLGVFFHSGVDGPIRASIRDARLHPSVEQQLTEDMKLSPAEMSVLRHAVLGLTPTEIAARLGRGKETVRSHLKSISGKLSLSGQAQLTATVRKIEQAGLENPAGLAAKPDTGRDLIFSVGDRKLAYSVYGDVKGRPILFCHCFLHGRHLPKSIEPRLRQRNRGIWSMSRMGFGFSDFQELTREQQVDLAADDYARFVTQKKLGRVDILAQGTGFATAYRFAHRYPELTGQIVALNPVPPANTLARILEFKGLFRSTALAMYRAPFTFELMHRFVLKRLQGFKKADAKMRRHIIYPDVPLEDIESDDGRIAMTQNVKDLIINDLAGCIQEAKAYKLDWAALSPDSNSRPYCTVMNSKDNPFVSNKVCRDFAQEIGAQFTQIGPTFPFLVPHMDDILNQLEMDLIR